MDTNQRLILFLFVLISSFILFNIFAEDIHLYSLCSIVQSFQLSVASVFKCNTVQTMSLTIQNSSITQECGLVFASCSIQKRQDIEYWPASQNSVPVRISNEKSVEYFRVVD